MSKNLLHIAARAYNVPLALEPAYAGVFFGVLNSRMGFGELINAKSEETEKIQASFDDGKSRVSRSYQVVDGVAIIPVAGTLVHKSGYIGSSSGMMGYDGLSAQLNDAMASDEIHSILLDIDSCGGEVSGVQALSKQLMQARESKNIWAHSNETAASAAYWLASSADKVFLSETSSVGSIGVITAHRDVSGAMEKGGQKVTLLYSGAHKADMNPYEALNDDVRVKVQGELDGLRGIFAGSVAAGRNMSVQSILDTEAQMYMGQNAVDVGLADGVMSFSETLQAMQGLSPKTSVAGETKRGVLTMTADKNQINAGVTQEDLKAAVESAKTEAALSERSRIAAILGSDAIKGKEATAIKLATTTDMGVDSVLAVLETVPVANAQSTILQGMTIGANVEHAGNESQPQSFSDTIRSNFDKQFGVK